MTSNPPSERADALLGVAYLSTAAELFGDDALGSILGVSRAHNARAGVTGMLLYGDGVFLQAIEGPPGVVHGLLGRIGQDPRHRGVQVLYEQPLAAREFGAWTMGFARADRPTEDGASPVFDVGFDPAALAVAPGRARRLLLGFRSWVR